MESTSIGPKCSDGTYVKGMPFSRNDCVSVPVQSDITRQCTIHENEALLPNLATSQVFSSLEKINGYVPKEKNNFQNNKINTRPTPEESEYFYDEYVDYPFNETAVDPLNNNNKQTGSTNVSFNDKNSNTSSTASTTNIPRSGFTFFGMPLPSIDVSKFLNTGRKIDWHEKQKSQFTKYQSPVPESPQFETGGFTPMIPTTDGGFLPVINPTKTTSASVNFGTEHENLNYHKLGITEKSFALMAKLPPTKTSQNNTKHMKSKSEIHEVEAYVNNDNTTQITFVNRTQSTEDQGLGSLNKYHLMQSNFTVTQVTERENIITTDTSNDMSAQAWIESTTSVPYNATLQMTLKPLLKKNYESPPTALSAVLIPGNEEIQRREFIKRPATITKVILPHLEHSGATSDYTLSNNREPKTGFSNPRTRTKNADDKDWYYKNYNNSNLEPYIEPDVRTSTGSSVSCTETMFYCLVLYNSINLLLNV